MKKSIKTTLLIWMLLSSVIVMVIGGYLSSTIMKGKIKDVNLPTMESYYSSISDTIDSTLVTYVKQLEQLNCYRIDSEWDSENIADYLIQKRSTRPSYFDYLAYLDEDGFFWTDLKDTASKTDYSGEDDYISLKRGTPYTIYGSVISKATGQRIIRVSVKASNAPGWWVGMVNFENLSNITSGINCNWAKFTLFKGNETEVEFGDVASVYESDFKYQENTWKETKSELIFANTLENVNWDLVMQLKQSYFDKAANVMSMIAVVIVAITVIIVVLISYILLNIQLKGFKPLQKAIDDIAKGDADLTKRIDVKAENDTFNAV